MDHDLARVRALFDEVIQAPLSGRPDLLSSRCGDDSALKRRVEALIATAESDEPFLSQPTRPDCSTSTLATPPLSERPGIRIGPYKLLQQIGEGGFGVVFMAEQDQPVRRRVALKIIKLGMDTRQVVARFEQERQALALMDHPNIAKVLDAGTTDSGRPYFVMEYVKGDPVTAFADAHKLSVPDRLELFAHVCAAVQHAHTKGIVHRDIKPRNVLVSMSDGRPFAKVIDFGIAKATGARLTEKTLFTEHRQLIGTPEYMSPEQAEGSPDIDTRTDVYSLGVLLYELLTGATPFDAERLRSAAYAEMQRIIKEEDPPAPSVRLSRGLTTLAATAAARQAEPTKLGPLVKGELDWIVMKALEKDRARRYEGPSQLAADVRRHLAGEPVEAAPPSAAYRVRKFVGRYKGLVAATGAVAAALVVGVAGTTWQWWRADGANAQLREVVRFGQNQLGKLYFDAILGGGYGAPNRTEPLPPIIGYNHGDPGRLRIETKGTPDPDGYFRRFNENVFLKWVDADGREADGKLLFAVAAQEALNGINAAAERKKELEVANVTLARQRDHAELWVYRGNIAAARIALNEGDSPTNRARLDACSEGLRNWEWGHLDAMLTDAAVILRGHSAQLRSAVFSPDGTRVLTVGDDTEADGSARVWDLASGQQICTVRSPHGYFTSAGFAPDGKTFLTLTAPRSYVENEAFPSVVQTWDAATGNELSRLTLPDEKPEAGVTRKARAALSPDGARLLWSRANDTRAAIIDLLAPDHVTWLGTPGKLAGDAAFSPDGRLVCTVQTEDRSIKVHDAATGEVRFVTPLAPWNESDGYTTFAAVSPDSRLLMTSRNNGATTLWDISNGAKHSELAADEGGQYLESGRGNVFLFPASFSPDGKFVASLLHEQRGIRLWEAVTGRELWRLPLDTRVDFVRFSRDGTLLATSDESSTTRLLDARSGTIVASLTGESLGGPDLNVPNSPFSPDGRRLITKALNGDACIWDLPITPGRTEFNALAGSIYWSIFVPSTSTVVAAVDETTLKILDAWTGREKLTMVGHATKNVYLGVATRDGRRLATVDWDSFVRVWDLERGTLIASRDFTKDLRPGERHADVRTARFLGNRLLVVRAFYIDEGDDAAPARSEIIEWDADTGRIAQRFEEFGDCWRGISISPTDDRIIFGASKGSRTLVDARSGAIIARLDDWHYSGWGPPAAFSPDGRSLAGIIRSPTTEERLQFWRAADGAPGPTVQLDRKTGMVQAIKFSPDGTRLALATWIGEDADGGRVVFIDAQRGQILWSVSNPGKHMDNLDFSPDGSRVATSRRMHEAGLDLWDTIDGTKLLSLPYRLGEPFWIDQKDWRAFSDDGACLFVSDRAGRPVVLYSRPRRSAAGETPLPATQPK